MSTQANLFGEQRRLSSIFSTQPAPTAEAQQASEERAEDIKADILPLIEEKKERIEELKEEIEDAKDELTKAEEEDINREPDEGEEDIFDPFTPQLEADLEYMRTENEEQISTLEEEIEELEAKLKP